MPQYTYSVANDTKNGKVDRRSLESALRDLTVVPSLSGLVVNGDDLIVVYFTALADPTETSKVTAAIAAHEGIATDDDDLPKTVDGKLKVQVEPRSGTPYQLYSLNWADKTTWYQEAIQVVNEPLTHVSGNVYSFGSGSVYGMIDVTHGKITQEHRLTAYAPVLTAAGTTFVEREYDWRPGVVSWDGRSPASGDYVIDYRSGTVEFFEAQAVVPTASYYHPAGSGWTIEPPVDSKIKLIAVEVQFSEDLRIRDNIIFQPQIRADAAAAIGALDSTAALLGIPSASWLLESNEAFGDPYYSAAAALYGLTLEQFKALQGLPIPDGMYFDDAATRRCYKNWYDYINEAQRAYPRMESVGGPTAEEPRALASELWTLRWPYEEEAVRILSDADGTRIRIFLEYDQEFVGSRAVTTVYALLESDSV